MLTLIALVAGWNLAPGAWRPQLFLASADRPKFPFGGKRREPPLPESSGPDLLDDVAGGRYGGGQTLLPALGGTGEKGTRLPRLFPDLDGSADAVDDRGFDDDLITWAPEAPSDPTVSVGLVPPPRPMSAGPGDPGWPRELGLLEAIADLRPAAIDGTYPTTTDGIAAGDRNSGSWGGAANGGTPATSPFALEALPPPPFSDLAPVEPWEYVTVDEPRAASTTPWQPVAADQTAADSWEASTTPWQPVAADQTAADSWLEVAVSAPTPAPDHDADSWHSWQWQTDEVRTAVSPMWEHELAPAAPPHSFALPAEVQSSWSDIFDIFQSDDDPIDPIGSIETDPDGEVDDDHEAVFMRDTVVETRDAPGEIEPAPGDAWASTLLDRLRAVVATSAEPVEALQEFNLRFARGLRLRLTNEQVVQYLAQGVHLIAPDAEAQVMFASSGDALDEHAVVGPGTRPGCDVTHADLCPAVVHGDTLHFDNSTLLDACPHLTNRPTGTCAAVCVPLERDGDVLGVVHITTLLNAALPAATVDAIEHAAQQVSVRLVELNTSRHSRGLRDHVERSIDA